MKNQTIGTEIEMTGITRQAAAKVVAEYFGTTENYVGGTYDAYEIEDNDGRIWKVMYGRRQNSRGWRRVQSRICNADSEIR